MGSVSKVWRFEVGKTSSCKIYHHATYFVDIPRPTTGATPVLVAGEVGEEADGRHKGDGKSRVGLMGGSDERRTVFC